MKSDTRPQVFLAATASVIALMATPTMAQTSNDEIGNNNNYYK